jgi:hypothetical protein
MQPRQSVVTSRALDVGNHEVFSEPRGVKVLGQGGTEKTNGGGACASCDVEQTGVNADEQAGH